MADSTQPKQTVDSQGSAGPPNKALIGLNVALAVVLAIALTVAVNFIGWWLADRYDVAADTTATSRFSFSSRTEKVLKQADERVRITSLYVASERDEEARRRRDRVADLLANYERRGNVEAANIDPTENIEKLTDLRRRIAAIYVEEAEPYRKVIREYLEMTPALVQLFEAEQQRFEPASQTPGVPQETASLMGRIAEAMGEQSLAVQDLADQVRQGTGVTVDGEQGDGETAAGESGMPRYGQAVQGINQQAQAIAQLLDFIERRIQQIMQSQELPEPIEADLGGIRTAYDDAQGRLATLQTRIAQLEPLELDRISREITLNSIIVEGADQVRVLGFDEVWPVAAGQSRFQPDAQRLFAGEDAVTAAILAVTSDRQPVAMFVRWGGEAVSDMQGDYTQLATRLERANFRIADWDLQRQKTMPEADSDDGVVLVLLPPMPQQRNQRMPVPQAPPEAYDPVREALDAGVPAMVFGQLQFPPMIPAVPYYSLLEPFGLDARGDMATVYREEGPDGEDVILGLFETVNYPSKTSDVEPHPIVEPLEGIKLRMNAPITIAIADDLPAGVTATALVSVPANSKYWGETNLNVLINPAGSEAEFDPEADLSPPYPVAVAAERVIERGGEAEEGDQPAAPGGRDADSMSTRVVAFGDASFVRDSTIRAQVGLTRRGMVVLENPANAEIAVNSMLWLAGQEEAIGVSPETLEASLIGPVGDTTKIVTQWLIWAGLPIAVVIVGVIIISARKRS